MTNLNVVILEGFIVKDSELKETDSGLKICNFTIAVNKAVKENENWVEHASFFPLQLYGTRATSLGPYLKKGTKVSIEAYLQQNRWEKEGKKFSKIEIKVEKIFFTGNSTSKKESTSSILKETEKNNIEFSQENIEPISSESYDFTPTEIEQENNNIGNIDLSSTETGLF